MLFRELNAVAAHAGSLQVRIDILSIVMLAMSDETKQIAHDELRSPTLTGGLNGRTDSGKTAFETRSVHTMPGDAVADRLVEQVLAGKLAVVRSGVRVLIVRDDDNERKFLHGGGIEPLMKRACGCAAIADTGRTHHAGLAFEAAGQQTAGDEWDHRAKMADHRVVALTRTATVNIPIAPAHGTKLGAEISPQRVENGVPKSHAPRLVADERRKKISLVKMESHGNAQRFLALAEENATRNQPGAIEAGQLFLQDPRLKHDAECLEVFIALRCGLAASRRHRTRVNGRTKSCKSFLHLPSGRHLVPQKHKNAHYMALHRSTKHAHLVSR